MLFKLDWVLILDNLNKSLEHRTGRLLSLRGRIILVNIVLSATMLYYVSFFLVLLGVRRIVRIGSGFNWSGLEEDKRKFTLSRVTSVYNEGGRRIWSTRPTYLQPIPHGEMVMAHSL